MTEISKNELCILGPEGDSKITWDPSNEKEVKSAEKEFNDCIRKNYTAYAVTNLDKKGSKITTFNPFIGKIILVPPVSGG